jgi:hypothetical protein
MTVAVPIAAGTQFRTTKGSDNVDTEGVYVCTPSGIAIPATAANGLLVDVSRLAGQQALDTGVAATVAPVIGGMRAYTGGVAPAVDTDNDAAAFVGNRTGELSVIEGRWGMTLSQSPVLTSGYANERPDRPKVRHGRRRLAPRAAVGSSVNATVLYRQQTSPALRLHLFEKDPGTISTDSTTVLRASRAGRGRTATSARSTSCRQLGNSGTTYQFQLVHRSTSGTRSRSASRRRSRCGASPSSSRARSPRSARPTSRSTCAGRWTDR